MKLSECRMGVLVATNPDKTDSDQIWIGHVVGLVNPDAPTHADGVLAQIKVAPSMRGAAPARVWPVVRFCGQPRDIYMDPDSLDLYTG